MLNNRRSTFSDNSIQVINFSCLGHKGKFAMGKPRVTYIFHKSPYQDDDLNALLVSFCL